MTNDNDTPKLTVYLGNRNYSSWSMRAWLMLQQTGAPFDEVMLWLHEPESSATITRFSPSGRVPALHADELVVWDSLAIGEFLAEQFPAAALWPTDRAARATARSVSAEMHSGFAPLRERMPCNLRRSSAGAVVLDVELKNSVARIGAIWRDCRSRFGKDGPFLFGRFCIADAMYAPVVTRFTTYGVAVDGCGAEYMKAIWAWPAMQSLLAAAQAEGHTIARYDL